MGKVEMGDSDAGVRGIIFDFGGVFTRSDVIAAWLEDYDGRLGLAPGSLQAALYSGEMWEMASTGQITREDYWQRVGAAYEAALPPAFGALRRGLFHTEPINEAMIDLARRLQHGYPLALCSNALDDLEEVLDERPDIRQLFDAIVISKVVGLRKPNPAILALTAARLGLPVEACLLVDDKPRNTAAAETIGMQAVVFESTEQLERTLDARGLLVGPENGGERRMKK